MWPACGLSISITVTDKKFIIMYNKIILIIIIIYYMQSLNYVISDGGFIKGQAPDKLSGCEDGLAHLI